MKKKKVFLGGTCGKSTWREELTPECQERELQERENCDYCLYVITPEMEGFYSIAEVVDDSNKRPEKTIFCVLNKENPSFNIKQLRSFRAIEKMVSSNASSSGGRVFSSLKEIAEFLN
jgi:hypothetical protein